MAKKTVKRRVAARPSRGDFNQYEVAKNLVYLQGVVIDIDDATGKGRSITRVREHLPGT